MPVFLQVVTGASPTASGLQMVPMMAGMFATSIAAGQFVSRTGRYRVLPIAGLGIISAGMFGVTCLTARTGTAASSAPCWSSASGSGSSCRCW